MEPVIAIFRNLEELSHNFAEILELKVSQTRQDRYFSIALSGGSTPKKVFEYISQEFRNRIAWDKLLIFWGDERCVSPESLESNFRMAKESLLDFVAIPVNNIFRIWGEDDPVMEAGRYTEIIRQRVPTYNGIPRLDMILLGLGEDGHTASIFPGDLHLFGSEKLIEVTEHPLTKQKRITVTGKVINNAKDIIFIVTGEPKAKMIDLIIYRNAGWEKMPASLVQPGNGELTWLLDENAAINLPVSVRRRRT